MKTRALCASLVLLLPGAALAQGSTEFPADAVPVQGEAIKQWLGGKVIVITSADGGTMSMDLKADGALSIETDRGYRDSGRWRIEGDKWCNEMQKRGSGCSEVRRVGDAYYYRRASNNEVVRMEVRK